jgi:tRNA(fMet)-specific endonuclease VapC
MSTAAAAALLDTDTLSEIMKGRNRAVVENAAKYLERHGTFTFSLITRYEILRGLKAKRALKQLAQFEKRCAASVVLPISDEIIVRAADLYAALRQHGFTISDADLFIAATAAIHNLRLVTNNVAHFRSIPGLQVESWSNSE